MKICKKIIAMLLALLCVASLPLTASAVSMESGLDDLKVQFVFGEGPVAGDY